MGGSEFIEVVLRILPVGLSFLGAALSIGAAISARLKRKEREVKMNITGKDGVSNFIIASNHREQKELIKIVESMAQDIGSTTEADGTTINKYIYSDEDS